jgi:hypothetical protein
VANRRVSILAIALSLGAIALWLATRRMPAAGDHADEDSATTATVAPHASGVTVPTLPPGRDRGSSTMEEGFVGTRVGSRALDADIYQTGGVVTLRVREIEKSLKKLVRQCYDTVHAERPDVRGHLGMSVSLQHDPDTGNLVASADLNKAQTTVRDHDLLECATENVFAAGEVLDQLRADHDPTGGNIVFELEFTFPPVPEPKQPWPPDDASPSCAAGTVLAGDKPPRGDEQWCERPGGVKDGDDYQWSDGKLVAIMLYVNGTSSSMRMRPLDDD